MTSASESTRVAQPYSLDELKAVVALLEGTIQSLQSGLPKMDTNVRWVLGAMSVAATSRLFPIKELLQWGALPEAAVLARTLLELEVSAAFISSAPSKEETDNRASRFMAFDSVQRIAMVKRIEDKGEQAILRTPERMARLDELKIAAAEAKETFPDIDKVVSKGWAGGVWEMIKGVNDSALRERLKFTYGFIYASLSDYAHPTINGLRHIIGGNPPDEFARFGIPLFAASSATELARMAAIAGGMEPPDTLKLIMAFLASMPPKFRDNVSTWHPAPTTT